MPQAVSISLGEFTKSVQSAVKEATANHPEFKLVSPKAISVRQLIWGFPIPDGVLKKITVDQAQGLATQVAKGLAAQHPGLSSEGAIFTAGGHLIVGVPPVFDGIELGL